jgi:hypothetical protein
LEVQVFPFNRAEILLLRSDLPHARASRLQSNAGHPVRLHGCKELSDPFAKVREATLALIGQPAKGKICNAINGIVDERRDIIEELKASAALDAGLVASAQSV